MSQEDNINFWLSSSSDDFNTAKAMLIAKRYNYTMFMCQQCLEELLKAVLVIQTNNHPPFLHDLILLSRKINLKIPGHILKILTDINPHYIIARYKPQRFDHKIYNLSAAKKTIKDTSEAVKWFTKKMALEKYSRNL